MYICVCTYILMYIYINTQTFVFKYICDDDNVDNIKNCNFNLLGGMYSFSICFCTESTLEKVYKLLVC